MSVVGPVQSRYREAVLWPYLKPFVRYSASKTGMTLKTALGFVQGHRKWHHLIDRIRLPIRPR